MRASQEKTGVENSPHPLTAKYVLLDLEIHAGAAVFVLEATRPILENLGVEVGG